MYIGSSRQPGTEASCLCGTHTCDVIATAGNDHPACALRADVGRPGSEVGLGLRGTNMGGNDAVSRDAARVSDGATLMPPPAAAPTAQPTVSTAAATRPALPDFGV